MGCCGAWSRGRAQYIRKIQALYPNIVRGQAPDTPQNVKDFIHYAIENPQYLRQIGEYLFHRVQKHIRKRDRDKALVAIKALKILTEACGDEMQHVTIYENSIKATVLFLIDEPDIEFKTLSTQLFMIYATKQAEDRYGSMNEFFEPVLRLCNFNSSNEADKIRVRRAGLSALRHMIVFNSIEKTSDRFDTIIPAILSNLRPAGAESVISLDGFDKLNQGELRRSNGDEEDRSLDLLSQLCLQNLAEILKLTNVSDALKAVMKFLDSREWMSVDFCVSCIRVLINHSKELKSAYPICSDIQAHVEVARAYSTDIAIRILLTFSEILETMLLPLDVWHGLLNLFLHQLKTVSDSQLLESYFTVVRSYCSNMTNKRDPVELLEMICSMLIQSEDQNEPLLHAALYVAQSGTWVEGAHISRPIMQLLQVRQTLNAFDKNLSFVGSCISTILAPGEGMYIDKVFEFTKHCSLGKQSLKLIRAFVFLESREGPIVTWQWECLMALLAFGTFKELAATLPLIMVLLRKSLETDCDVHLHALIISWFSSLPVVLSKIVDLEPDEQNQVGRLASELEEYITPLIPKFIAECPTGIVIEPVTGLSISSVEHSRRSLVCHIESVLSPERITEIFKMNSVSRLESEFSGSMEELLNQEFTVDLEWYKSRIVPEKAYFHRLGSEVDVTDMLGNEERSSTIHFDEFIPSLSDEHVASSRPRDATVEIHASIIDGAFDDIAALISEKQQTHERQLSDIFAPDERYMQSTFLDAPRAPLEKVHSDPNPDHDIFDEGGMLDDALAASAHMSTEVDMPSEEVNDYFRHGDEYMMGSFSGTSTLARRMPEVTGTNLSDMLFNPPEPLQD